MRSKSPELMKEICTYVSDYYRIKRSSPSVSEIAKGVGIAKTTAYRYLIEMDEKGMLKYDGQSIDTKNIQRSDYKMNRAPVIGSIACGSPELTDEAFEEFVALPVALFGEGDFYVLRTHGDSMIEAGIDDGDKVVVRKQNHANAGDIVVALVDNETTLKTYYPEPEKHRISLHPENKTMKDIIVRECYIQGVAEHVIKKLNGR